MSQPAKAQEPSMEEILASIRRIIADDDTTKPAAAAAPAAAPAPVARPAAMPPRNPVPASPPPRPAAALPEERLEQHDVDNMIGAPPAEERDEVLELTEQMTAPAEEQPSFQTIDGQSDVVFTDPPAQPEPPPRPTEEFHQPLIDRGLMSSSTSAAVDSAFNSLAHTVLVQNARTLEDLVREMLRPMLKSWLDDNLPSMVERIVRAEIERVSRGR
jgi:hypothetical protein